VGSAVCSPAGRSGWSAGALGALGWVEDELAGGGVDDPDLKDPTRPHDVGCRVGSVNVADTAVSSQAPEDGVGERRKDLALARSGSPARHVAELRVISPETQLFMPSWTHDRCSAAQSVVADGRW